jgi:uncharacterized membrane protein SpoIIM required for sporulation
VVPLEIGLHAEAHAMLERLGSLLDRCERVRADALPFEELRELGRLYRRAATLLARLRERGDDPEAIRYLNALCVRAYGHLTVPPRRTGAGTGRISLRIRAALGRTWRAQLAAWALLAIGVYVGAALVAREPRAAYALVPSSLGYSSERLDQLLADPEARLRFLGPQATPVARNAFFGSMLFANNTRVAMFALATGILAAVPTILLTVYNGVILGAFGAIFLRPPHGALFLAWILPHGIPELTAIALCSAGGLLLGSALVAPGRRGRRLALREAGESALLLLAAAVPLLIAAALIESFVRESTLGVASRLGVAAAMGAALGAWLIATRRLGRTLPDTAWLGEVVAPGPTARGGAQPGEVDTSATAPARSGTGGSD